MIMFTRNVLYLLILLFLFHLSVFSQNETASLIGTVLDADRAAILSARIELSDPNFKNTSVTTTNREGEFRYQNLTSGKYLLTITAAGFANHTQPVEIGKGVNRLEIGLEPENVAVVVSVSSNYLAGSDRALEKTAGSFQAIGPEELTRARVFNFAEALRKVSGVSIRSEEGFGLRPNISIRGSDPTRSRKVLLLEDGVPLSYAPYGDNSSYYHPPIERFASVEVLKGSGQIEYGPVTVAGMINYLTPNPTDDPHLSLQLSGGNRSFFNSSLSFSDTIGDTGLILNYVRKQGEGSRDNIRSGINDFSAKIIRPLTRGNILTVKYSHFDESSRITYSGLTETEFAENPRQNPFRNDDLEFFREGFSVSHTGVITPRAFVTTNFYTSYFSRDWWRQSSNSGQRPNRLGSDPDCTGMVDLNTTCGNQGTPRDFRTLGIEPRLNLQYEFGEVRNELSAGFRLHYETQNRRKWNGFTPDAREEGSEITERNLRNTLAVSGFFQNRFIWKNLSLTPGVRIEKIRYQRTNLLNQAFGETTITEVIPGLGLAYNIFGNTTIFAGVHRGFAPPSTSDILTNSGGVVDLDSELSWNYEAGIRTRPFAAAALAATFFRNDYENQIIPSSVAGGIGSTRTNAGETLQQGVELNAQIDTDRIFDTDYNFYFKTAYTFLDKAEFRSLRFSGVSGFEDVLITGNRLPYSPRHLATSSLGFVFRNFDAFIENNYIGRQFADDLNTTDPTPDGQRGAISPQIYFNATANYRVEKWNSTFFVTSKNIFDRLFIVDRTRGIYPSSPRLVQIGWKWDLIR